MTPVAAAQLSVRSVTGKETGAVIE